MQIDASHGDYLWDKFVSGERWVSHYTAADKDTTDQHLSPEQLQIAKFFISLRLYHHLICISSMVIIDWQIWHLAASREYKLVKT